MVWTNAARTLTTRWLSPSRPPSSWAAKGAALDAIYAEAMEKMRPEFGHWVIFEHCMPFNVSRAYDEANGHDRPRIWTAERDVEMWSALEKTG